MSLVRFFSKPRWQSKDDAIRRSAVATDNDPELVESLPRLAREDADAGVRIAALKRLADPGLAQAMAVDDRDEGVRNAARNLWSDLLAGAHASAPPLADRLRLLRAQDDPRLIERIATSAPEAELRLAALKRIDRKALLLDRVTADSDAAVRLAALERIEDEAQLARIVERARKSDKTISRLAAERLDDLRVGRGDADAIAERARILCERLERVLREGDRSDEAKAIADAWTSVAGKASAALAARYRNARELFELSSDPQQVARLRQRAQDRVRIETELAAIERILAGTSADAHREELLQRFDALAGLHAGYAEDADESGAALSVRFTRLGAQLAALKPLDAPGLESADENAGQDAAREAAKAARAEKSAAARAEREHKQTVAIGQLHVAIEATAAAIRDGRTADAHANYADMARLRREIANLPAALRESLAEVEGGYATIRHWQRWSDDQRREQLCEELEVLPEAGLHPDALATRLREIQAEWSNLDRLEARPAHASDALARRFRALCRKAIEPARPYFEKRDELRRQGSQETAELIARARAAAAEETADGAALAALRKQLANALRSLDRVDPRERKNLAGEIKNALGAIDAQVSARHAEVESAKNDLIERAGALASQTDNRTAMNQARDLQKLWQKTGNGRRARDQAQWKRFRAAIDAVFGRADEERRERSAQEQQALEAAARLCAEFETLAAGPALPDRAAFHAIENAWRALVVGDAALRQRFQSAQASLHALEVRAQQQKRRAEFDVWMSHYELCRQLERGQLDAGRFASLRQSLPALELAAEQMQQRLQPLLEGAVNATGQRDPQRDCVLEIEQLAGIEPPPEDRQRRMDLQVGKLSARMRGVQAPAPATALRELLRTWLAVGPVAEADLALETRFKRAIAATLESLA